MRRQSLGPLTVCMCVCAGALQACRNRRKAQRPVGRGGGADAQRRGRLRLDHEGDRRCRRGHAGARRGGPACAAVGSQPPERRSRCASLALSPLPLIFSYTYEKSLCGAGACRWCGALFGLTLWQYNCSACGWKVCGECSPHAMELTQWLEGSKPHELRRAPSNTRLRVCIGCWYAAQASARGFGAAGLSLSFSLSLCLSPSISLPQSLSLQSLSLCLPFCLSVWLGSKETASTTLQLSRVCCN